MRKRNKLIQGVDMKKYLVFCKDQEQWDDYVKTHIFCLLGSLFFTFKDKGDSFIITDNLGNQSVYVKMVPCKDYRKSFPLWYGFSAEKIWLTDEKEFVNLAWVDKYL